MKPIDIVLASFNGERYIEQQILSIQENKDYDKLIHRLIVVDDGSTDNTEAIIQRLSISDHKIRWVKNTSGQHGASLNFSFGVGLTTAPYVMLCDQDDIWLKEKISCSYKSISKQNNNMPCLVFSDLTIVDEELQLISPSYFEIKKIPKYWHESFDRLLKQNVASGCTMIFNRALITIAFPIHKQAYMHDWWIILIASSQGQVVFIDKSLMLYRQHLNNTIGINEIKKISFEKRFNGFIKSIDKTVRQNQFIFSLHKHVIGENKTLLAWNNLPTQGRLRNIYHFIRGRLCRHNLIGNIAMLIYIVFFSKSLNQRNRVIS